MKRQSVGLPIMIAAVLLPTVLLMPRSFAQVEVEINVAGPWSYSPDPDPHHSGRIELIAPMSPDHVLRVLSGDDVQSSANISVPPAGSYTLDVPNLTTCSTSTTIAPSLYPLSGIAMSTISGQISSGNTFAISLPKPCSYESYVEARAVIGNPPLSPSQEKSFAVWMVLHYTVSAVAPTSLQGSSSYGLTFSASTMHPPGHIGASIVLYNISSGEDFQCDRHSADAFDETANTLWNQSGINRWFPELYNVGGMAAGDQSHRYNGACSTAKPRRTCSSPQGEHYKKKLVVVFDQIEDEINVIRTCLNSSTFGTASQYLRILNDDLITYWDGHIPEMIQEEVSSTQAAVSKEENCSVLKNDNALKLTEYISHQKFPGRTDCHAPQFDINHTVNP